MKKDTYKKEMTIKNSQQKNGALNNRADVRKIQSWLTLFSIQNPHVASATAIDGDFGKATEKAVKNFQESINVPTDGIITQKLFSILCSDMKYAFEKPLRSNNLRDLVLESAENHVKSHPLELVIKGESNSGPWVRSYMDGHQGSEWFWCMGFVQTIIDQACSKQGKSLTKLMPWTYSCDTAGTTGLEKGLLSRYTQIRKNPNIMKPGDVFLIQKSKYDWFHTGIITHIDNDIIETIEGNTNREGSHNGIAVMKRTRNYRKSKIDVFSINPIVN
ncbi:peptidoglycan-binding protein [Urechidicola croceus]|uniref:Peptidoglycan-binding protein n=1 Tax=Urechidicola croceus TaxID=1850246 RepID=A0A1D8PAA0_9FLAO|nr:peptidoglycan-binding protein [Urechidicola croceus]AOW21518.1 peptidoglycan-binding protein [Urechidicola croceus]